MKTLQLKIIEKLKVTTAPLDQFLKHGGLERISIKRVALIITKEEKEIIWWKVR